MNRGKDLQRLGRILRNARYQSGRSLRILSESSGVPEASIVGLEQAEYQTIKAEKLSALARALELNDRDLYGIAGLLPNEHHQTISGLLRIRYRGLPDEAIDEIQNFVDYQVRKHTDAGDQSHNQQKAS